MQGELSGIHPQGMGVFAEFCSVQLELHELLCLLTELTGWECWQSNNAASGTCSQLFLYRNIIINVIFNRNSVLSVLAKDPSRYLQAETENSPGEGCDFDCDFIVSHMLQVVQAISDSRRSAENTEKPPGELQDESPGSPCTFLTMTRGEEQGLLHLSCERSKHHLD